MMMALSSACHPKEEKTSKQMLDATAIAKIKKNCPGVDGKYVKIYYLDGDCSMCIGKAKELELKHTDTLQGAIVLIALTKNEHVFRLNMESAEIKSCFIVDELGYFGTVFKLNMVTHVNRDHTIERQEPY